MAEATAARQKKWYDPTYSHGMSPEERDAFLGSPDSAWLLPARRPEGGRLAVRDADVVPVARRRASSSSVASARPGCRT